MKQELTAEQKLEEVSAIVRSNLFPIYTSFVLDLDGNPEGATIEQYARMKELLNIDEGIDLQGAIEFDTFKRENREMYDLALQRLHKRLIVLSQEDEFYQNLSSHMFMMTVLLGTIGSNMQLGEFQETLNNFDGTLFNCG